MCVMVGTRPLLTNKMGVVGFITLCNNFPLLFVCVQEANAAFRTLLNRSTQQLKALAKKLGSCIDKSRPYYDAYEEYKTAQEACQEAAVQFQRAYGVHKAAKETIALAEQRFLSQKHEWKFDNAWQEMLNQATIRVRSSSTVLHLWGIDLLSDLLAGHGGRNSATSQREGAPADGCRLCGCQTKSKLDWHLTCRDVQSNDVL